MRKWELRIRFSLYVHAVSTMHGCLCAVLKGQQVFCTEQYRFGRPFTVISRKYTMGRIFFANPFAGLGPSYGFPAVNRFCFFHLPLLACPVVAAVLCRLTVLIS